MRLTCRRLTYTYPGADSPIFTNLDWSLEAPGFHALFGLSGVGKSTLARLVDGELTPEQGTIEQVGNPTILYAYNTERLPGWYTVGEHLRSVTPPTRRQLLAHIQEGYGLEEVMDQRYSHLSMGQKNRVNLARYLVQDFDLLIADEVLANVDEPTREHILADMKARFPERTFLYISHNVIEVARFCQKVYVLPHAPHGARRLVALDGLDQKAGEDLSETVVQERVFAVLQAASSAEG